ncbi:ABC transporter ATP-binding protein [Streptomyces sp. S6]
MPKPLPPHLRVEGVSKTYRLRRAAFDILDDVTLTAEAGQVTAVVGDSGSGKTALLHIMALLDRPDRGRVLLCGDDLTPLDDSARADIRRRRLGLALHSHDLLPGHPTFRNVLLPHPGPPEAAEHRARELLDRVGLLPRASHLSVDLSPGERQRVTLARALINDPPVVLTDHLTTTLDPDSRRQLLAFFRELADEGRAVVLVTDDPTVADTADTAYRLARGALVTDAETEEDTPESGHLSRT